MKQAMEVTRGEVLCQGEAAATRVLPVPVMSNDLVASSLSLDAHQSVITA